MSVETNGHIKLVWEACGHFVNMSANAGCPYCVMEQVLQANHYLQEHRHKEDCGAPEGHKCLRHDDHCLRHKIEESLSIHEEVLKFLRRLRSECFVYKTSPWHHSIYNAAGELLHKLADKEVNEQEYVLHATSETEEQP